MEKRISGGGGAAAALVVAVMVALVVLANDVNAQRYTCWGGCYNECFLRNQTGPGAGGFACYYQCLNNTCVPTTPADYQYYCQIGCSLERCYPLRYQDAAKTEACFGTCDNTCKRII